MTITLTATTEQRGPIAPVNFHWSRWNQSEIISFRLIEFFYCQRLVESKSASGLGCSSRARYSYSYFIDLLFSVSNHLEHENWISWWKLFYSWENSPDVQSYLNYIKWNIFSLLFFPTHSMFFSSNIEKSSTTAEHFHVFVWKTAQSRVSWQTQERFAQVRVVDLWRKFGANSIYSQCIKKWITSQIEADSHANYVSVTAHVLTHDEGRHHNGWFFSVNSSSSNCVCFDSASSHDERSHRCLHNDDKPSRFLHY